MAIRLTERDTNILRKCAVAQWLTTSQVWQLFFAEATPDAVRKRLRKLTEAGYLRTWQEHPMAETLHTVGPKGKSALEALGFETSLLRTPPKHLAHFIGINDIRVAVECGAVPVVYCYAAWELPQLGWTFPAIPDAIFSIGADLRATFLVEYDRGNETAKQFSRKIASYEDGIDGFPFDAALIIGETEGRLGSLGSHLRAHDLPPRRFFTAHIDRIREAGMFAPVFCDISDDEPELYAIRDFIHVDPGAHA